MPDALSCGVETQLFLLHLGSSELVTVSGLENAILSPPVETKGFEWENWRENYLVIPCSGWKQTRGRDSGS